MFFEYGNILLDAVERNEKVLICTAARPDGNYDYILDLLLSNGAIEMNQSTKKPPQWNEYDWVFIPGGNNAPLKESLLRLGFSIENLKSSVTYIGDSAGAMVLGSHYYRYDKRNSNVEFHKGVGPNLRRIFIVHNDNPHYVDNFLRSEVQKFAQEHSLQIITLNENQELVLEN